MTLEDGHFVLSVPAGGSMTFNESGRAWTFGGLLQEVNGHTDAVDSAASQAITALVSASVSTAEVIKH
jgi:hypothetical protein